MRFSTIDIASLTGGTVTIIIGLICVTSIIRYLYNLFLHPLRRFPGPYLNAISCIPHIYYQVSGNYHKVLRELHMKYGPIVRMAPGTLSISHPDGMKNLRDHRKGGKAENGKDPVAYSPEIDNILGAPREKHALMRRVISHAFSAQAMKEQEPLINGYVDTLFHKLRENCAGGTKPLDLVKWYNFTTFDIIGDLAFGDPFGCLETSTYHSWVEVVFQNVKANTFISALGVYPMLRPFIPWLMPRNLVKKHLENAELAKMKTQKRLAAEKPRPDFFGKMIEGHGDKHLTLEELASNAHVLILGGSETTATLLSAVTYFLGKHPHVLVKLTNEVLTSFQAEKDITLLSTSNLKYMHAVLDEAMRVYPPVPATGPRKVAPDGDIVAGEFIPGNTSVEISQYVINHNPDYFTLSEVFIPERWLDDKRFSSDRLDAVQPFSIGPRNCVGRNLAYAEMRLILARLIWNFDMRLAEESLGWDDRSLTYILWEKSPLHVYLTPRNLSN